MGKKIEKCKEQPPLPGMTPQAFKARSEMLVASLVQELFDGWITQCRKRPTPSNRQRMREEIHAMVVDGIDAQDISRGITRWLTTGLPPSTLQATVDAVMNQTPRTPRGFVQRGLSLVSERTAHSLDMIARFEAMERGELPAIEGLG